MVRASLHRGPFLTPIWLTALAALGAFCVLTFAVWVWGTADSTIVIVIRHAEKASGVLPDPPLSAAGEARAELLGRMFGNSGAAGHVDAIYVSPTARSRMTAAPLAGKLGIDPIVANGADSSALAQRVMHDHTGGRVLVVGHSDTVNEIVEALSGSSGLPPIGDDEYGTLYVVSVPRIGRANVLRLNY
jgi:broad specificity phosphatase PhoE